MSAGALKRRSLLPRHAPLLARRQEPKEKPSSPNNGQVKDEKKLLKQLKLTFLDKEVKAKPQTQWQMEMFKPDKARTSKYRCIWRDFHLIYFPFFVNYEPKDHLNIVTI